MKISKTDLIKVIKEELTAFYVTPNAFAQQKKNEADDSPKATGDKAAWKKYFNKTWDEFKKKNNLPTDAEIKDLAKLSSELKKQFYNTVDAGWTSKEEKTSKSKQESISILDDEIDEPQLVVTEGFKVGTKISKVLAQSSTIKIVNPKDPRWIFAIVSRFGSKGVTNAAAQDKVSMVVVDKAGKVIKDWGSHLNAKAALKFAQSKGYTKKIDEARGLPQDAAKSLLKKENSDVDSLKPNDPSKKPLQELRFVVKIADIGNVIVDGGSEGEIRTRLIKKLRGGKKDIISIQRISKGKADQAAKKMGVDIDGRDGAGGAEAYGFGEVAINEANPADVKRLFNNKMKSVLKTVNIIKQSLGYLNKRQSKDDSGTTKNLMFLVGIAHKLNDVEETINKFPQK